MFDYNIKYKKLYTEPKHPEKIVPVLTKCLQNNNILTELVLPVNLISSTTRIGKAVNYVRKRRGLPLIKVKGTYAHVCTSE